MWPRLHPSATLPPPTPTQPQHGLWRLILETLGKSEASRPKGQTQVEVGEKGIRHNRREGGPEESSDAAQASCRRRGRGQQRWKRGWGERNQEGSNPECWGRGEECVHPGGGRREKSRSTHHHTSNLAQRETHRYVNSLSSIPASDHPLRNFSEILSSVELDARLYPALGQRGNHDVSRSRQRRS